MALNGNYLYIGDFGNNNNKRKNLTIYRFSWKDAFKQDSISTYLKTIAYA
jgi:hypothetical protein